MEWLLALVLAGGGAFGARRWWPRLTRRRERAEELAAVRALADEDVTYLGEQLQRLDAEVAGHPLEEAARLDYQRALDAYEAAQRLVPRLADPEEFSKVADILFQGRYALVCAQARVAGLPVPELRVPCFFNPQHGPSVQDVVWTRPGHGTRTVPACAQDAARVANGERPDLRLVRLAGQQVPYYEVGEAFLPYSKDYFAAAMLTAGHRGGRPSEMQPHPGSPAHHAHHGMGGHHGGGGIGSGGGAGGGSS